MVCFVDFGATYIVYTSFLLFFSWSGKEHPKVKEGNKSSRELWVFHVVSLF